MTRIVAVVLLLAGAITGLPRVAGAQEAGAEAAPDTTAPSTGGLFNTIDRDMGQIATKRTLAILATGGALAGVAALLEDPSQGVDSPEGNWWDQTSDVGNAYGNVAFLGVAAGTALLIGHSTNKERLYFTGSEMVRSLAYSEAVVLVLKFATQRTRPDGNNYSFPSGHSTAAFAVAPVFAARYGVYAAVPAYMLAGVTAFGRVEERKHFPSDVVFGAAIGLASGVAVTQSDALLLKLSIVVRPEGVGLATRF